MISGNVMFGVVILGKVIFGVVMSGMVIFGVGITGIVIFGVEISGIVGVGIEGTDNFGNPNPNPPHKIPNPHRIPNTAANKPSNPHKTQQQGEQQLFFIAGSSSGAKFL